MSLVVNRGEVRGRRRRAPAASGCCRYSPVTVLPAAAPCGSTAPPPPARAGGRLAGRRRLSPGDRTAEGLFLRFSVFDDLVLSARPAARTVFDRPAAELAAWPGSSDELRIKADVLPVRCGDLQQQQPAKWSSASARGRRPDAAGRPNARGRRGGAADLYRVVRALADEQIAVLLLSSRTYKKLLGLSDRIVVIGSGERCRNCHQGTNPARPKSSRASFEVGVVPSPDPLAGSEARRGDQRSSRSRCASSLRAQVERLVPVIFLAFLMPWRSKPSGTVPTSSRNTMVVLVVAQADRSAGRGAGHDVVDRGRVDRPSRSAPSLR